MNKIFGIGIQNFEALITENVFYVDKTHFIKEWWESRDEVTMITRQHGFGKMLKMVLRLILFFQNHCYMILSRSLVII